MKLTTLGTLGAAMAASLAFLATSASAHGTTFTVCAHGCKYRTIQKAVDAVKDGSSSTVKVKPGTYVEGVVVKGHKFDGLKIVGAGKKPSDVVLNGKHAKVHGPGGTGQAQNGILGENVDDLTIENMWAKNYAANGFFIFADGTKPSQHCDGFLLKNDWASFNKSYGLFAKHCTGGRITKSKGWGQGDSAIYIGETPVQGSPVWTSIDHNLAYENVLGYSGTNSKYVDIHDNEFVNNGAGVVPNTLDSEMFEPTATGKIHNNDIFWNNFDYFRKSSKVLTVSHGLGTLGDATIWYPTGVGVALFGADGWIVKDNNIFGNFKWGAASFSDPFNAAAVNQNNTVEDNTMGRNGTDTNGADLFNDGSGSNNCFDGNVSSTLDMAGDAHNTQAFIYPECPAPGGTGTGDNQGDGASDFTGQVGELATYVLSNPPCDQENAWTKHSHPAFKGFKPLTTTGPCTKVPAKR